jgi:hypothetical protein
VSPAAQRLKRVGEWAANGGERSARALERVAAAVGVALGDAGAERVRRPLSVEEGGDRAVPACRRALLEAERGGDDQVGIERAADAARGPSGPAEGVCGACRGEAGCKVERHARRDGGAHARIGLNAGAAVAQGFERGHQPGRLKVDAICHDRARPLQKTVERRGTT